VVDGCRIRELPDGGREFVLDQTALSFIRIDDQSRLRFGLTEVAIASPFVLATGGRVYHMSPQRSDGLGPLVALYPGSVRWMWTSPEGELRVVFDSGAVLTVSPDPVSTAWSVGNVYAEPGGAGPPPAA
jgi:hypothetical protein